MVTYKENPTAEECVAHVAKGGVVEFQRRGDGSWWRSVSRTADDFQWCMDRGWRYRLVLEDPVLPPGAPAGSVPSLWTPGAVICLAGDVPRGWEARGCTDDGWELSAYWRASAIVEARPPAPPATEDVPLHKVIGRRLYVDDPGVVAEARVLTHSVAYTNGKNGLWATLPMNPDGTVTVLAEDGES